MNSNQHTENMNQFYSRKWQGHEGYWLDRYPPAAQIYAICLGKARNDAIARAIPDGLENVLDIGCGIGDLMLSLSDRSRTVIGLDVAAVNVKMARQNFLNDDVANAIVLQGSGEGLPFAENCFDVVVMADVIEHIQDTHAALCEISRVLRPGGILICVTPRARFQKVLSTIDSIGQFPLKLVRMLLGKASSKNPGQYERFLSPKTVKEGLERSGMTPLEYTRICFYPGSEGGGLFRSLMSLIHRVLGNERFEIFVRKVVYVFARIEKMHVFNQKQMWIARF